MKIVTCPECGAPLQALIASNSYAAKAHATVKAQLGVDLLGPQVLFPIGPLVAHHDTVHPGLPLRKYLAASGERISK